MDITFKNIALKSLGLKVQFVNGVLDLPARKGETFYDWGDVFEPLVSAEDIFFGDREIIIDAFFDERSGVDFKAAVATLEAIRTEEELVTEYGTYNVKLSALNVEKSYKGGKTLKIKFKELNPDLNAAIPTTTGQSSVRIDSLDLFVNFGLLVEKFTLFEIPELKNSRETSFKTNYLSLYRQPEEIAVKVHGIYASKAEMSTKISGLNALLAKPGLRHFVKNGDGFQCYAAEGHKVTIKKNRVEINLKLRVMMYYNIEEIVTEVLNRVTIEANPQSSLIQTDVNAPDYIKGKDTFVAADAAKLGNQLPAFYAKESEIKDSRELDLAGEIDNNTTF
jgi:hypothetical protein